MADFYSKNFSNSTEWMLKRDIFIRLCKHFFLPDIDLFASTLNKQLGKFVTWFPEPEAFHTDAFTLSWKEFSPYVFPPFNLLGKVVNKIIQDEVDKAIIIFPHWKSQAYFSLILSALIDYPVRLPRHQDLLRLTHSGEVHPLAKQITLIGAVISGNHCKIQEFHHKLLVSSSKDGEKEPGNNMIWPSDSGIFGVINDITIHFKQLKVRYSKLSLFSSEKWFFI